MKFIDQLKESLQAVWFEIAASVPKILGAIAAIIIALLVIKLLVGVVRKTLKIVKADKLDDKINQIDLFGDKKININIIDILVKVVKWLLYVILIFIITDILELTMVSDGLKNLLGYLPKLFTALAIFVLGLLFGNFVKKSLQSFFESMELSGAKMISQIVFLLILVFVSVTALNQAGIDTEIITSNITLIIGAILLAFTIAFGLGARNVIEKLLSTFYTRKLYEVGQKIEFNGIQGEIEAINSISVTLKTKEGKLIVPIKDIVESRVSIQD
jgi:hypothetical protein